MKVLKPQASDESFKKVLEAMEHIDRLNFIWMYDQYVQGQCEIDPDSIPVIDTIEDFYYSIYKPQIQEQFKKSNRLRLNISQGH